MGLEILFWESEGTGTRGHLRTGQTAPEVVTGLVDKSLGLGSQWMEWTCQGGRVLEPKAGGVCPVWTAQEMAPRAL